MNNEEINILRSLFREEVNTSEQRLRGILREEIDAAVYASEARMTERMNAGFKQVDERLDQMDGRLDQMDGQLGQMDGRLGQMDGRLNQMDGRLGQMDGRLDQMDGRLNQMDGRLNQMDGQLGQMDGRLNRIEDRLGKLETGQQQLKVDLSQTISVLDEATRVINDFQKSQYALEEKVEDNMLAIRRDIQKLTTTIHTFAKEFIEMNGVTNDRITLHERTPLDQAHPRPHSAA